MNHGTGSNDRELNTKEILYRNGAGEVYRLDENAVSDPYGDPHTTWPIAPPCQDWASLR